MAGKKETQGMQSIPVTQYRKQIGKQDVKKSKTKMKEIKNKAQSKKTAGNTYKEVALLVGPLAIIVLGIYAVLYYLLAKPQ